MSTSKRMSDMDAKNGENMFDVLEDMIWNDMDFWQLINKNLINQVISYWTSYRSSVSLRPRSNTANLGPVTGPIRNNLINNIIIYLWTQSKCSIVLFYNPLNIFYVFVVSRNMLVSFVRDLFLDSLCIQMLQSPPTNIPRIFCD